MLAVSVLRKHKNKSLQVSDLTTESVLRKVNNTQKVLRKGTLRKGSY